MKYLKIVSVLAIAALAVACAAKLPQADVDAATAAFNDAKAAGADVYAADSFKAAADAQAALQADLDAKSYGKTKDHAKALLDASTKAKADVEAGKAAMKDEVQKLMDAAKADLPVVQKELAKAAKLGKNAKVDVKTIQTSVAGVSKALTAAQATLDSGDIAGAKAQVAPVAEATAAARKQLEDAGYKI